jgi:hypothetical protein
VKTTIKIKRPKFYDYFTVEPQSTGRVCAHEGCENPATHVDGYYLVVRRRVRTWVCASHWRGNPQLVLPTPPSILAALVAEEEYHANMAKRYHYDTTPSDRVSVKTLASSGHGPSIPSDRVANWRWGA